MIPVPFCRIGTRFPILIRSFLSPQWPIKKPEFAFSCRGKLQNQWILWRILANSFLLIGFLLVSLIHRPFYFPFEPGSDSHTFLCLLRKLTFIKSFYKILDFMTREFTALLAAWLSDYIPISLFQYLRFRLNWARLLITWTSFWNTEGFFLVLGKTEIQVQRHPCQYRMSLDFFRVRPTSVSLPFDDILVRFVHGGFIAPLSLIAECSLKVLF